MGFFYFRHRPFALVMRVAGEINGIISVLA